MTANQTTADPWVLCKCLDRSSKWWWGFSLIVKAAAFLVGLAVFIPQVSPEPIPFLVAVLTITSELAGYRMERVRGIAQGLRRKLEALNSFGWEISSREMSDLLARCSGGVKKRSKREVTEEPYFASKEEPGPKRAAENVMESAWWSKHLSESMFWTCSTIIGIAVVGSLVALVVSILSITDHNTLSSVARIVTSVLLLGLSCGLLRLAVGYYGFGQKAGQIEIQAEGLLAKKVAQVDAIKLLHEYQLARSAAPILPEWIWKWRRDELNGLWSAYRQKNAEDVSAS
ncbi:MAG: hypothetical protein AB7I37_06335 [Pirellulales bacterium]